MSKNAIVIEKNSAVGKTISPFICHFKPMEYDWRNNGNGGTEEFFVCSVCGCVKDPSGNKVEQRNPLTTVIF